MNRFDLKYIKNTCRFGFQGLATQFVFTSIIYIITYRENFILFPAVLLTACAGMLVWLLVFLKSFILKKEARYSLQKESDALVKRFRMLNDISWLCRKVLSQFTELGYAGLLGYSGYMILNEIYVVREYASISAPEKLLTLTAVLAFAVLVAAFYFRKASLPESRSVLRGGAGSIALLAFMLILCTVTLAVEYFKIQKGMYYFAVALAVLLCLISFETLAKMFFRLFRPRKKGEELTPAYESYFVGILMNPLNIRRGINDVVNNQFGFEVSKSTFYRMLAFFAMPMVFFSVILLFALSSVVVVDTSEKAIVLKFGNLTDRILEPGLNFKAPWPFETVKKVNTWRIHRIRIGSHQPIGESGDIYQKGMPVLWTNLHGVVVDELLIVAPPSDLIKRFMESADKDSKIPSVSLAGIDLQVEYRVDDVRSFLTSCVSPGVLFKQIAEAESSRAMYQYDIDELFCKGRIVLSRILKKRIQKAAKHNHLGIKVLTVAISGVHPPQEAADSFEATVVAEQEKERIIQSARQHMLKNMIETVGSVDKAKRLLKAINATEKATSKKVRAKAKKLLFSSEGAVSQTLSKAVSYRWKRENVERGKAERFQKESLMYKAAPEVFMASYYMSVLEKGLIGRKKYMFIGDRKDLILRFDFKDMSKRTLKYKKYIR